jgi:hypothetical protein
LDWGYVSIQTNSSTGNTDLRYTKIQNPKIGTGTYNQAELIAHSYFEGDRSGSISSYRLENSIVHKIPYMDHGIQSHHLKTNLLDNLNIPIGRYGTETIVDTAFLQDNQDDQANSLTLMSGVDSERFARFFFPDFHEGNTYVAVFGPQVSFSVVSLNCLDEIGVFSLICAYITLKG